MKKIIPAIALCLFGVSCTQNQDGYSSKEANVDMKDSEITLKVKTVILADDALAPSNRFVSITTNNGVVVITGKVSNADQMRRIAKKAESVSGVKRVDNRMTLSDS
ncbi:MAG: BON domain-containing protein [Rhabdochlamydiaceae bacterium]|nr:BON domain-containing protein [Rhabdochlamydiaceae bacterium]